MYTTLYDRRDRSRIVQFLSDHPQVHYHLDWEPVQKWLADPHNLISLLWEGHYLLGMMAFSPVYQGTSWLRVLVLPLRDREMAVRLLWEAASPLLTPDHPEVSVLVTRPWVEPWLRGLGFQKTEMVINLSREAHAITPDEQNRVRLRGVRLWELAAVLDVDHAAFHPMWQMRENDLREAGRRAYYYTVAHNGSRIIGYQITMRYLRSMHLARLAVLPDYQGQGIASQLVRDMLVYAEKREIQVVTVNTQLSNEASQRIYYRYHFVRDHLDLPVYSLQL